MMSSDTCTSSSGHSTVTQSTIRRKPVPSSLNAKTNGRNFNYPGRKPAKWHPGGIIVNKIIHNPFRSSKIPPLEETNTAVGNGDDGFTARYKKHMDANSLSPMFKDSADTFLAGMRYAEFQRKQGVTTAELTRDETGNLRFRKEKRGVNYEGSLQSSCVVPQKKAINFADEDRLTGWTDEHLVRMMSPGPLGSEDAMENSPCVAGKQKMPAKHIPKPPRVNFDMSNLKQPIFTGPRTFVASSDRLVAVYPHPNDILRSISPQSSQSSLTDPQEFCLGPKELEDEAQQKTIQATHANILAQQARMNVLARERFYGVQEYKNAEERKLATKSASLAVEQKRLDMRKKQQRLDRKSARILEAGNRSKYESTQLSRDKLPHTSIWRLSGRSKEVTTHGSKKDSLVSGTASLLQVFVYGVCAALTVTLLIGLLKR